MCVFFALTFYNFYKLCSKGDCALQCFVFGAAGAGKTSLLEGLVRQQGQEVEQQQPLEDGSPTAPKVAVNEVTVSRDQRGRQQQGAQQVHRGGSSDPHAGPH